MGIDGGSFFHSFLFSWCVSKNKELKHLTTTYPVPCIPLVKHTLASHIVLTLLASITYSYMLSGHSTTESVSVSNAYSNTTSSTELLPAVIVPVTCPLLKQVASSSSASFFSLSSAAFVPIPRSASPSLINVYPIDVVQKASSKSCCLRLIQRQHVTR